VQLERVVLHFLQFLCELEQKSTRVQESVEKELGVFVKVSQYHDCNLNSEATDNFSFDAPTTRRNLFRVLRALESAKPVMLEGSPGAGKSSLINKLAAIIGKKLVQINLCEQTDVYDLFGNDVPVARPDGSTSLEWIDGPVLKAIKVGSWILLDEMNLASQSVLEGLNSCLDFRKNLFIPELNKTFEINNNSCKFFACQNPHIQGGGRKQLPKSFLNRFLPIYVDEMNDEDFVFILCERFSKLHGFDEELIFQKLYLSINFATRNSKTHN